MNPKKPPVHRTRRVHEYAALIEGYYDILRSGEDTNTTDIGGRVATVKQADVDQTRTWMKQSKSATAVINPNLPPTPASTPPPRHVPVADRLPPSPAAPHTAGYVDPFAESTDADPPLPPLPPSPRVPPQPPSPKTGSSGAQTDVNTMRLKQRLRSRIDTGCVTATRAISVNRFHLATLALIDTAAFVSSIGDRVRGQR